MSTTINCLGDINTALRTAASYQAEGNEVQIKGHGKNKVVTYFVIVENDELMKDHLYSELNEN